MLSLAFAAALGQHQGKARDESHLPLPIQHCTVAGGCKFENTSSVLDSNWRWTHEVGCTNSSKCNCFLGNVWVNETCKDVDECTTKCAIDGEDTKGYKEKCGISADGQPGPSRTAAQLSALLHHPVHAGMGSAPTARASST